MSMEEFIEVLRKRGFDAEYYNNDVYVFTSDTHDLRVVQAIAQEVGYGLSFSWRGGRDAGV